MKLINADYLTGRIFTEADLTNAHTCYESIMAIIESMESEDVLNKIRAEIEEYKSRTVFGIGIKDLETGRQVALDNVLGIIDKYKGDQK